MKNLFRWNLIIYENGNKILKMGRAKITQTFSRMML
jgi:hypothetical protein